MSNSIQLKSQRIGQELSYVLKIPFSQTRGRRSCDQGPVGRSHIIEIKGSLITILVSFFISFFFVDSFLLTE